MRSIILFALLFLLSLSTSSAAVCGGAGYDLSGLTFSDIVYNDTKQYTWYLHPCGNVTAAVCQNLNSATGGGTMFCQQDWVFNGAYSLATWIPENTQSVATWIPFGAGNGGNNGARGVRLLLQDGALCGSTPRALNVTFQCQGGLAPGTARMVQVVESPQCTYNVLVFTSAVCQGPNSTQNGQQQCGTQGLNLAPITTTDLIWKDPVRNYTYYYRPCGVVTSAQCANNPYGSVAGEAMMCQAAGTNNEITPYTYDIAWWNPTLATYRREGNIAPFGTNGWSMTIADGTTCDANYGASRILSVFYICAPTYTTPVFVSLNESSTCNYQAYILTNIACNNSQQIQTANAGCGGAYDLTFATVRDLVYTPPNSGISGNGVYYVLRLCGIVDNAICQANANTNTSMMCQAYQGSTTTYDLAIYNPTAVTYTPTLNGLKMYMQDGDQCGSYGARQLTINFVCQPGGPPNSATFTSLVEATTCNYIATVTTNAVCRTGRQNGICGSQNYDFSVAGNTDYAWVSANNQYTYYFQPCGQVVNAQCNANNNTVSSMMCQAVNGQATTYDIAFYDSNLVAWFKTTTGMQMYVQDGQSCVINGQLYDRALTVNFVCGSAPVFNNLTEDSTTPCNYIAFVTTPQACAPLTQGASTGISLPVQATGGLGYETLSQCGGPYNLLPLSTYDLTYTDVNYNWVLRTCGAVSSNSNCTAAAANTPGGWMMCQDSLHGTGDYEGSSYNQYTVSWTPTRNGVIMTQSDGALCGSSGNRVTRVTYTCNQQATTAYIVNVTEAPTCTYTFVVYTNLVCPVASTQCGGAGYDLSSLTTRGDLSYTNNAAGYTYYFRPCGTVANSGCQANLLTQSAMMCQASTTSNATYNIAVYLPSGISYTALPAGNGVQMVVQDGSTCDGYDFERLFTANFICGAANYSMVVNEDTICHYVANVYLPMACSTLYSSSSSSSLSGGAIAGIVIGSVVGAAIILGVLLVICCGRGSGWSTSKKRSSDLGESKATGSYSQDLEESQSNVEMHTNTSDTA